MFIYNLKLNKNHLFSTIIAIFTIIILSLLTVSVFKVYKEFNLANSSNCIPKGKIAVIDNKNYTNILKMVHDDLDSYIGQEISYTGYVYRVSDIKDDEFILARDMIVSNSPKQTVIVGFLCKCNESKSFENGTWVTITGTIEKGYYVQEIPIIKITDIKRASKPSDSEVPLPDEYYVPTSVIY